MGDEYVINGSKMWITNGTRADFITLAVRTGGPGYEGISLVTFPTDVRGFSVSKKLDKVGNLSSDTAVLYFEDCRIPARYLLGEENGGFAHIMINFQGERLVAAVIAVSGMELMLQDAIHYARERQAFGRPLIGFQVWRHRFAEHLASVEAAKRLTYHAIALFDAEAGSGEGDQHGQALRRRSRRSGWLTTASRSTAEWATSTRRPVARAWRDVRLITIGGGTSEIMKEIIVKLEGL